MLEHGGPEGHILRNLYNNIRSLTGEQGPDTYYALNAGRNSSAGVISSRNGALVVHNLQVRNGNAARCEGTMTPHGFSWQESQVSETDLTSWNAGLEKKVQQRERAYQRGVLNETIRLFALAKEEDCLVVSRQEDDDSPTVSTEARFEYNGKDIYLLEEMNADAWMVQLGIAEDQAVKQYSVDCVGKSFTHVDGTGEKINVKLDTRQELLALLQGVTRYHVRPFKE